MTWGLRRQIFYVVVFIVAILTFSFLIIYPSFNKAPTCTDNKQNGDETGIDCGGSCTRACLSQTDTISTLWARSFEVVPGRYNAVAYLENHNKNTAVRKINYRFRFADAKNVYIGKREGSTYVPPSGRFAVFEPGIGVGNSVPIFTSFEFTQSPVWETVPQNRIDQLKVLISNISLVDENTSPKLSATIRNNSLFRIPEVNVIAILYDVLGNAVAVSRTYIDMLDREELKDITFTWPEPLSADVVAKEIIPIYNVFSVQVN